MPVMSGDGLSQVSKLSMCSKRCVTREFLGFDAQVTLLKLVLLGLGEVSLQVEHSGVKRSSDFFM